MKSLYTFLLALVFTGPMFSQTASNFTKSDCDGNSRTLFSTIDEGKVVILFFSMGCSSCEQGMENLKPDYLAMDTNVVKLWYLDYNPGSTCQNTQSFLSKYQLRIPSFPDAGTLMQPYGFGMPLIVVTGGKDHKVYYKGGYNKTSISNAVKQASSAALFVEIPLNSQSVKVIQNLEKGWEIQNLSNRHFALDIYDLQGKKLVPSMLISSGQTSPLVLPESVHGICILQWEENGKVQTFKILNP